MATILLDASVVDGRLGSIVVVLSLSIAGAPRLVAAAEPPANPPAESTDATWTRRYEAAQKEMLDGRYAQAAAHFAELAASSASASDRRLAAEMARLASAYGERERATPAPPGVPPPIRPQATRSTDEITVLYVTSFLYGIGTGAWFLLQVQPDSALTATLPFAAFTAAPVIALATIDGAWKLRRGLPQSISSGLVLGLAEGIWLTGYQAGRASRTTDAFPSSDPRWSPEISATMLWGGATLGGILGAAVGSSVPVTPGRASFVESTALWSGAVAGLASASLLPEDDLRRERAFVAAGIGLNAGLVAGFALAGPVSPSIARVRIVDLAGAAGGLVATGLTLAVSASSPDVRLTEGMAALGVGVGLGAGILFTAGMPKDSLHGGEASAPKPSPLLSAHPSVQPVNGGAVLGVGGSL